MVTAVLGAHRRHVSRRPRRARRRAGVRHRPALGHHARRARGRGVRRDRLRRRRREQLVRRPLLELVEGPAVRPRGRRRSLVGAFFENDENWPQAVLDGRRARTSTRRSGTSRTSPRRRPSGIASSARRRELLRIRSGGANKELRSCRRSAWASTRSRTSTRTPTGSKQRDVAGRRRPGLGGAAGLGRRRRGSTCRRPTRDKLNVYIGESTGHKDAPARRLEHRRQPQQQGRQQGLARRPGTTTPTWTSYFATRQWIPGIHAALGDEALWQRALRYADRRGGELDHDLKGALNIGMMTGHWQGQGEPCNPALTAHLCDSRNGPAATHRRCGAPSTRTSRTAAAPASAALPGAVIPLFGQPTPTGDLLADRVEPGACRRRRVREAQGHVDEGRRAAGPRRPTLPTTPTCTRRRRSPASDSSRARSTARDSFASRSPTRRSLHQGDPVGGRVRRARARG